MKTARMWIIVAAAALGTGLPACEDEPSGDSKPAATQPADPADAEPATQQLAQRFQTAMEQGNPTAEILADARRLTQRYPEHAPAHRLLAQVLLQRGEYAEALAAMERSLEVDPAQPELHWLAGTWALKLDKPERAAHHAREAMGLEPERPRYLLLLAQSHIVRGQWDQAREAALRALALDSSEHGAHKVLADLFARQNKMNQALDHIRRARKLAHAEGDTKRWQTYVIREAVFLRRDNRPDEAYQRLRALPAEVQVTHPVLKELALTLAMRGQPEMAGGMYENVLQNVRPDDAHAAAEAARWYLKAQQPDDAKRMIDRLSYLRPNHPRLTELRAQLEDLRREGAAPATSATRQAPAH